MTISYMTKSSDCSNRVNYGENRDSIDSFQQGTIEPFRYKDKYYTSGYIHHVTLNGLKPNTLYYYSPENDRVFTFTTQKMTKKNFDEYPITFGLGEGFVEGVCI